MKPAFWVLFLFIFLTLKQEVKAQHIADSAKAYNTCVIETYPKIYFTEKNSLTTAIKEVIKESNCEPAIQIYTVQLLQKAEGTLTSDHLNRALQDILKNTRIVLKPEIVHSGSLANYVQSKLSLNNSFRLRNLSVIGQNDFVKLTNDQVLEIQCSNCEYPGEKNIKLNIIGPSSTSIKSMWLNTTITKTSRVQKAKDNIRAHVEFSHHDFEEVMIDVEHPEIYVQDTNYLKHKNLVRPLKAGEILKHSDLIPKKLVQYGDIVDVVIEKNGLSIKTQASARKSGTLNDKVELLELKTKKPLTGTIVDYKLVKIEI